MTDETANLIVEHLRRIRGDMGELKADVLEVKQRGGHLEHQYATISNRLHGIDRLDRIERRLDLVEA